MINLVRYLEIPGSCTFGMLLVGNKIFNTLELPWRDNERNRSCIPPGEYQCVFMERSSSGRYRNCFHVKGVPGRTGILIHAGNVPEQTKGCILIGRKRGSLCGKPAVLSSKVALSEMAFEAERNSMLRITSWTG